VATKKPSDEAGSAGGSIPVLSEVVSLRRPSAHLGPDRIAALQSELVAQTLKTAEELLHAAARDIEATLLERVADQLRARLPEIVDRVLKEQLSRTSGPRHR
jgi:fructose 1,6-bisphosphatase